MKIEMRRPADGTIRATQAGGMEAAPVTGQSPVGVASAMNRCDAGLDIVMVHTNINTGGNRMTDKMTSLRVTDDEASAVQKTQHRISLDSMEAKIVSEEYIQPTNIPHMTIAVLVTENGFALVGHSAPADPENYDEELGRKFARENALRQLWPLEAYLLRERMML